MNAAMALLLDMSLKASLLCLAASILSAVVRRRSAALRHDIRLAAIACCLLVPPISAAAILAGPILPFAPVHQALNAVAPSLPAAVPAGSVETLDQIWSGDGAPPLMPGLAAALVCLWLAGIAVVLLRTIHLYRAAAAIVRRAAPFEAAHAPASVTLLITAELSAPAVFGVRKPAVLLPLEARLWPADRLRAVLAHEIAHVERRDCAVELVVELAIALHWFNPLVRRAAGAVRMERELACDERAVAAGLDARAYADALVRVARGACRPSRGPLLAMARPSELERRVVRLLSSRPFVRKGSRLRRTIGWSAVALFVPLAAFTAPASGVLASGSVQPGGGLLGGLDDPMSELAPLPYERLALAAAAIPAEGPEAEAIDVLKSHLTRESRGYGDLVRQRAIWALTRVEQGRLFEPISRHVADRDWRVRAYAAWGLAAAGDRRAVPLLAPMLDDPVWRVRAMAAAALAELADPGAADALIARIGDPAWQVRISLLEYAGRIGDPGVKRRLRPLLDDSHHATRLKAERLLNGT